MWVNRVGPASKNSGWLTPPLAHWPAFWSSQWRIHQHTWGSSGSHAWCDTLLGGSSGVSHNPERTQSHECYPGASRAQTVYESITVEFTRSNVWLDTKSHLKHNVLLTLTCSLEVTAQKTISVKPWDGNIRKQIPPITRPSLIRDSVLCFLRVNKGGAYKPSPVT